MLINTVSTQSCRMGYHVYGGHHLLLNLINVLVGQVPERAPNLLVGFEPTTFWLRTRHAINLLIPRSTPPSPRRRRRVTGILSALSYSDCPRKKARLLCHQSWCILAVIVEQEVPVLLLGKYLAKHKRRGGIRFPRILTMQRWVMWTFCNRLTNNFVKCHAKRRRHIIKLACIKHLRHDLTFHIDWKWRFNKCHYRELAERTDSHSRNELNSDLVTSKSSMRPIFVCEKPGEKPVILTAMWHQTTVFYVFDIISSLLHSWLSCIVSKECSCYFKAVLSRPSSPRRMGNPTLTDDVIRRKGIPRSGSRSADDPPPH
jgi:hypothetical protein